MLFLKIFFFYRSASNRKVRDINRRNPKGELNSFLFLMVVKKVRSCGRIHSVSLHSRKDIETMHMVHAKLLQETCEQHSHRAVDLFSLHVLFTYYRAQRISCFIFCKLCVHMHVDKRTFEKQFSGVSSQDLKGVHKTYMLKRSISPLAATSLLH